MPAPKKPNIGPANEARLAKQAAEKRELKIAQAKDLIRAEGYQVLGEDEVLHLMNLYHPMRILWKWMGWPGEYVSIHDCPECHLAQEPHHGACLRKIIEDATTAED